MVGNKFGHKEAQEAQKQEKKIKSGEFIYSSEIGLWLRKFMQTL